MPTVSIVRDELFELLDQRYTEEEFDELCFEYGLELDDVVMEKPTLGSRAMTAGMDIKEEVTYKIEIPANRYDLLCVEGLSQALRVFLGKDTSVPSYKLTLRTNEPTHISMQVKTSTCDVRPYVVCAVLRDLHMTESVYKSLIDLQDKLHHNICRRRTLVAIGTHDLDRVEGTKLTYSAQLPQNIRFVPLGRTEEVDAVELMSIYENDAQLRKYVPIIRDRPKYPVIVDESDQVLSLPPIINGDRTKVSLDTRNMLIECTATDQTKASIVLNILVAAFSKYCEQPFTVEPVDVTYDTGHMIQSSNINNSRSSNNSNDVIMNNHSNHHQAANGNGTTKRTMATNDMTTVIRTPDFDMPKLDANVETILKGTGIPSLSASQIIALLQRMQLPARQSPNGKIITVSIPIIRPDILHECDITCDVAVAYGFNKIPEQTVTTPTVGKQLPLNHLSDLVRREGFAQAGYTEVLTWVTVSEAENFSLLRRHNNRAQAVCIGNPKTLEFEQCRMSLLTGLLKTLRENRKSKVPIRLFEVGDVILKSHSADVGAVNRRRAAAVYCGTAAGFEIIQGLLESVMKVVGASRVNGGKLADQWDLDEMSCCDEVFFPGRRADIVYQGECIGSCGWIHPEVLKNFSLSYPCSAFELDLQGFV